MGVPVRNSLLLAWLLAVTVVVEGLVFSGRLDLTYGIALPIMACIAGLLGTLAPRALLTMLFASAPLIWGLGDTKVLGGGSVRINLPMLGGFVIIFAFSHLLLVKDPNPGIERIRKLVLCLGLVCVPAIFAATGFFTGAGIYLRLMCPFVVMFAVLRHVRGKSDVLHYARSMAFALLAVAVVLMIAYARSELWTNFGGYTRLAMLYIPPQTFGDYLAVMTIVIMLNYLLTRNRCYLLLVPLCLGALFLTYVRTAWVGVVVLFVLLIFHIHKSYGRRLLLAALALSPLFLSVAWQGILRYQTDGGSVRMADAVLSGRLGVDAIATETYLKAPPFNKLFGIGFNRVTEATDFVFGEGFVVHDDYLSWLIEAGILALPLYLAILIALLKQSLQGKGRARERVAYHTFGAASVLILGVMIMGIPGAFYSQVLSTSYIYGIMGLMLSQSRAIGLRTQDNWAAGTVPAIV